MNPYERFRTVSSFIAAALVLTGVVAAGPAVRSAIADLSGTSQPMHWAALAASGATLLVIWSVLAGVVLPGILKLGLFRRLVLGRAYVEGSWIQAERGGANGPRLSIVSLKPGRKGLVLSSATLTRTGEIESSLQAEFHDVSWPGIAFKFRETLPADAGKPSEGLGTLQFDLTGGTPRRYSGSLQPVGRETCTKTEGVKLTSWRERRQLRSLDGRRDVISKYWSAFFEGPIVTVARDEETRTRSARRDTAIVPRRRATDWRKSDTTPTADRIREEFSASSDEAEA